MRDANLVKVHLGRAAPLVVVARLEVALGAVELVSVQLLKALAIDADGQHILLVANLVREAVSLGDVVDVHELLLAVVLGAQLHAHLEVTLRVVVELGDGLVRNAAVDVDLTDADVAVVLGNLEVAKEAVLVGVGVPALRLVLAQLAAAVQAVLGAHALRVGHVAGYLEDERAVALVGVKVLGVAVAVAVIAELVGGDFIRVAGLSRGQLELPVGEIKVSARCAFRIERSRDADGAEEQCNVGKVHFGTLE